MPDGGSTGIGASVKRNEDYRSTRRNKMLEGLCQKRLQDDVRQTCTQLCQKRKQVSCA